MRSCPRFNIHPVPRAWIKFIARSRLQFPPPGTVNDVQRPWVSYLNCQSPTIFRSTLFCNLACVNTSVKLPVYDVGPPLSFTTHLVLKSDDVISPIQHSGDVPLSAGYHGYFGAVRGSTGDSNTFRPRLRISTLDARKFLQQADYGVGSFGEGELFWKNIRDHPSFCRCVVVSWSAYVQCNSAVRRQRARSSIFSRQRYGYKSHRSQATVCASHPGSFLILPSLWSKLVCIIAPKVFTPMK